MATTTEKTIAGVLILLSSLAGFGGTRLLTEEQLDRAYVCPLNEDLGFFDRLSDSLKTGYWNTDTGEESQACRVGNSWESYVPLKEYANSNGISIEEFLMKKQPSGETVDNFKVFANEKEWTCDISGGRPVGYIKCRSGEYESYLGEIQEGMVK